MNDQRTLLTRWKRLTWLLLPIFVGLVIAVFIAPSLKKAPEKTAITERPVKVRAIEITAINIVPRVIGYGKIEPSRTWEAVAEVAGQVNWVSDKLHDGQFVSAGTELLRIEDSNYRLVLAQIEAQLSASVVKIQTARDSLVIAEKDLELLQTDLARKKKLVDSGSVSQSVVDAAERPLLAGQAQVTNLKNAIALNAAEREVLIAQRDAANLDLQRTHSVAPFDARITNVNIGEAQYANKGQLLFSADGLDVAEVAAQFPVGSLRPLISGTMTDNKPTGKGNTDGAPDVLQGVLALNAIVRLRTAAHTIEWPARISGVSGTVDPQTQSLGVVVAVDNPTQVARPGRRPPLFRNTFVEVELYTSPIKNQIIVPRNAIHQGIVHVINSESRLEQREVDIAFSQQGYVVIRNGIKAGEHIVTSDLVSAVEGMLLTPQQDNQTKRRLTADASGKEPSK